MSNLPPGLSQDQYGAVSGTYTIENPNAKWDRFYRTFDSLMSIAGMVSDIKAGKQQKAMDDASRDLGFIFEMDDPFKQEGAANTFLSSDTLRRLEKMDPDLAESYRKQAQYIVDTSAKRKEKETYDRNKLFDNQAAQQAAYGWMDEIKGAQEQANAMSTGSLPGIPAMPQLTPEMVNTFASYNKTPQEVAQINKGLHESGMGSMGEMGVVEPAFAKQQVAKQEKARAEEQRAINRETRSQTNFEERNAGGSPAEVVLPPVNAFEIDKSIAKELENALPVLRTYAKPTPLTGDVAIMGGTDPMAGEAANLLEVMTIITDNASELIGKSMQPQQLPDGTTVPGLSREQAEAEWLREAYRYLAQFNAMRNAKKEALKGGKKSGTDRLKALANFPGKDFPGS